MDNATNITTTFFDRRHLTCLFYLVFSSLGLALYSFIMRVLYTHRSTFTNSFYILVGYCAVGDVCFLLNIVVYVVPFSLANDFFIPRRVAVLLGNGDSVLFNTVFMLLGPVAVNRLVAILGVVRPKMKKSFAFKLVAHRKFVHVMCISCWLYGFGIALALHFIADCPKLFSLNTMTFGYNCSNFDHPLFVYYATFAWVYPLATFSMYIVMCILIRRQKTKIAARIMRKPSMDTLSQRQEVLLLIQSAIICLISAIETMAFIHLRGYGHWSNMCITTLGIINSSVNPIVYLIFNSTLRYKAIQMIRVMLNR